jgi:hypothetical protein
MKPMLISTWIAIAAALICGVSPSRADGAFDDCVAKLCVSSDQMNCWVKAGAELCDDNGGCTDVPDHAGALALERGQGQWKVQTQYGTGWVSDRYMMVDSSFCPGL